MVAVRLLSYRCQLSLRIDVRWVAAGDSAFLGEMGNSDRVLGLVQIAKCAVGNAPWDWRKMNRVDRRNAIASSIDLLFKVI